MSQNTSTDEAIVPCWAFFCTDKDTSVAIDSGNEQEAITNLLANNKQAIFLLDRTEKMVTEWLKNAITGSQLRKLFNAVAALKREADNDRELHRIRIQLIYIAVRQNNEKAFNFASFVRKILNDINGDKQKIETFKDFMEAVLSYHKYHHNKK